MVKDNRFDAYYEGKVAGGSSFGAEQEDSYQEETAFESEQLTLSGSARADSAIARHISISGSGHVSKDIKGETLDCSGSLNVGGNISASRVNVSGSLDCGGSIRSEYTIASGSCRAARSVFGQHEISASGSISAPELVSAEMIRIAGSVHADVAKGHEVRLSGGGKVGAVLCCDAYINAGKGGAKLINLFSPGNRRTLMIGRIESTGHVYVDMCNVGEINADSVEIGRNCSVDRIVYASNCIVAEGADVKEKPVRR